MLTLAVCYEKHPFWKILFVCVYFCVSWRYGKRLWTLQLIRSGFESSLCHLLAILSWIDYINVWHLTFSLVNMSGDEGSKHRWLGQQETRPQPGNEFSRLQGYNVQLTVLVSNVTSVRARTNRLRFWNRNQTWGFGHRKIKGQSRTNRVTAWWYLSNLKRKSIQLGLIPVPRDWVED